MKIVPPAKGYLEFVRWRTPTTRGVLKATICAGFLGFYGSIFWFFYLLNSSPGDPNPVSGQIVKMSNHGQVFFVRSIDGLVFNLMCWGGWAVGASGMIAFMSIFGSAREESKLDRVFGFAVIVLVALLAPVILTSGRFPYAMASFS